LGAIAAIAARSRRCRARDGIGGRG
jgi:hypothetical protein